MKSKSEKLFVYGILRFRRFRKEAFGRVIAGTRDTYKGYTRASVYINREQYFILKPSNSYVNGVVLEVTAKDLKKCDTYEHHYVRRKIRLKSGTSAWVYMYRFR